MQTSKKYGGITRKELKSLRRDLKREGVTVPSGDDVTVAGPYGIELRVVYEQNKETLQVSITKKPFFIPESKIWEIVDAGIGPYVGP